MTEYNTEKMNRLVYCYRCKVYSTTEKPDPKCDTCKSNLITVMRSIITGEIIIGEEKNESP